MWRFPEISLFWEQPPRYHFPGLAHEKEVGVYLNLDIHEKGESAAGDEDSGSSVQEIIPTCIWLTYVTLGSMHKLFVFMYF